MQKILRKHITKFHGINLMFIQKEEVKSVERFLMWANEVVGEINATNEVVFLAPDINPVLSLYTRTTKDEPPKWTGEQFVEFLAERVVNRDRRDIEKILFRCGISQYDVLKIAEITRGIHPKDLLWIAHDRTEQFEEIITDVFRTVFLQKMDLTGDSIDTPEGYNIKRYGVWMEQYGIFKRRISPVSTDAESEVAVFLLANRLGVPCCPAYKTDKDTIFSAFLYDFSKECVIHFRRLFQGGRSDNEYRNLVLVRPEYQDKIEKMILLDFITRQDDRHLSNIAIKINMKNQKESFYPLYDNGRSLFYEDTEEMVQRAVADPVLYATSFGYSGTYWDYIQEIKTERGTLKGLVNLDICQEEISHMLKEAGFTGYRFEGALQWIQKTIDMIKGLDEL